jgi:hypothetical protein
MTRGEAAPFGHGVIPQPPTTTSRAAAGMMGAPEQFGAEGRATGVAAAICGPVAAIAFARATGRNPTIAEALEIARKNGRWDADTGMHGPPSEQALLDDMGIASRLDADPTEAEVAADVNNGNPVIISSAGHYHYFVVTGVRQDPASGRTLYDTGTTGTALVGGSRWRSWDDLSAQAALFIDEPTSPTPSTAASPTTTGGAVIGAQNAPTDIEAFVRERAQAYGIDPEVAVAVANSEGGLESWNRQSDFVNNGVREPSYGPLQLYMNGGLGNAFMQETGLDPRDPANGPAATDWALKYASTHGWGDWHGAQRIGLDNYAGIGGQGTGTPFVTPGGTPTGRRNDSPFASAEQPLSFSDQKAEPSDPWAPVWDTLEQAQQGVQRIPEGWSALRAQGSALPLGIGQGAADLNAGAVDALNTQGDRLLNTASGIGHELAGFAEDRLNPLGRGGVNLRRSLEGDRGQAAYGEAMQTLTAPLREHIDTSEQDYGGDLAKLAAVARIPFKALQATLASGYYRGGIAEAAQRATGYHDAFIANGASEQVAALGALAASNLMDPVMWTCSSMAAWAA